MKYKLLATTMLAAMTFSMSAFADNLLETMDTDGGFKVMLKAIKTAGMEDTFTGAGPVTVFAPVDSAFSDMPKAKLDKLMGDKEALKKMISHHVVNGAITKAEVDAGKVKALDGSELKLSVTNGVKIDNVPEIGGGIKAENGVVHPLSAILPMK
ncbi:MAG: fasciclin domain-containing protein [Methylobacillus sp.]|nr:fasciclin domain-containing protein [Methylobacillus sp.]